MVLGDIQAEGNVESLIVCLLIVAIACFVVWGICHVAGRPDIGRFGAAVVAVVGVLLCLLNAI